MSAGGDPIPLQERERALQTQLLLEPTVALIRRRAEGALGPEWQRVVNARRAEINRPPIHSFDERAALAVLCFTPELAQAVGPEWADRARRLNGILNAAQHNDSARWRVGDAGRAEQLAEELLNFLLDHPERERPEQGTAAGAPSEGEEPESRSQQAVLPAESPTSFVQLAPSKDTSAAEVTEDVTDLGDVVREAAARETERLERRAQEEERAREVQRSRARTRHQRVEAMTHLVDRFMIGMETAGNPGAVEALGRQGWLLGHMGRDRIHLTLGGELLSGGIRIPLDDLAKTGRGAHVRLEATAGGSHDLDVLVANGLGRLAAEHQIEWGTEAEVARAEEHTRQRVEHEDKQPEEREIDRRSPRVGGSGQLLPWNWFAICFAVGLAVILVLLVLSRS